MAQARTPSTTTKPLKSQWIALANEWLLTGSVAGAARKAGYKGTTVALSVTGHRVLKQAQVISYIAQQRAKAQNQSILTLSDKREAMAKIVRGEHTANKDVIAACQLDAKLAGELDERPVTNVLVCGEDRLMRLAQVGQQAMIEAQYKLLDTPVEPSLP